MAKRFGVMIDMSRNAVMRVDELKRYIKILRDMGYNTVQLYTEDTYEVDGEPYFGYLRGRYSKDEMKDIVGYCNSIGVEAIPCMQTLAHLEGIFKWTEYFKINDTANILLIEEERTYRLIENMIKTLRECYTTDIIHIGMDEAHMLGLGKYLDKHGYQNRFEILKRHLERVIELCEKYDFKPIMWSDMFFRLANGGEYYDWNNITDDVLMSKPDGVDLVYWDYYHNEKKFYDGMLAAHNRFSGETWFAGGVWTWVGYSPYNTFADDAMGKAVLSCREGGVDNILMTLWGDNGKECSNYSVLPVLFKLRRLYDGITDMEQIKREFYEIVGESYDAMMDLEKPNMVAGNNPVCPSNPAKVMLFSDPLFGFLDVTVKDGVGKEFAEITEKLRSYAKDSKSFGYLFDTLAALTHVMEIKYDLGKRTRDAYSAGDKAALAALACEYCECALRVKDFHAKFSYQWHKENKPNGFEIQDYRLGGIVARLNACAGRITAYLDGKIERIDELEEELLPYNLAFDQVHVINGVPATEGIPTFDRCVYSMTVNNLN